MGDTDNFNILSIDYLNDDCLLHIFTFLSIPDRLRIERVSKRWQLLAELSWKNLKRLTLDNAFHRKFDDIYQDLHIDTDDKALQKVLQLCGPYLISIEFDHDCIRSSESVLSNLHTLCPNVKDIRLSEFCKLSTIKAVLHNFANLRSFSAECIELVEEELFVEFFDNNQQLRSLTIDDYEIQANTLSHLNHKAIENLCLRRNGIDSIEHFLNEIKKFKNLSAFEYEEDEDFRDFYITNAILEAIPPDALESLIISVTFDDIFTPQEHERLNISRFHNLKQLIINVDGVHFDDKTLKGIAQSCVKLTKLRIFGATGITDVGFIWVSKLPIESLSLSSVNISGKVLSNMKSLEELCCYVCHHINSEDLAPLFEISPKIRTVEFMYCQAINAGSLIDSLKKSTSHYLKVYSHSIIGGNEGSDETYYFRKVDNELSIKIERCCLSARNRNTPCNDSCSICSKQQYIHYIE